MPDNHCPDQEHVIFPIGIIKESTKDRTTIRLILPYPDDSKLRPEATILTRDPGTGAHARAVVRVVKIDDRTSEFSKSYEIHALARLYLEEVRVVPYRKTFLYFEAWTPREHPSDWLTQRFLNPAVKDGQPDDLVLEPRLAFNTPGAGSFVDDSRYSCSGFQSRTGWDRYSNRSVLSRPLGLERVGFCN